MKLSQNYFGYLTLLAIIVSTVIVNVQLSDIRHAVVFDHKVPKLIITDEFQFSKLCEKLATQWNSDGYAFYILQPKGLSKTYKEKVSSTSEFTTLPIRTRIKDCEEQRQLYENSYILADETYLGPMLTGSVWSNPQKPRQLLILPIYHYDSIVGEFYIFFDPAQKFTPEQIEHRIAQAQILGKLLY